MTCADDDAEGMLMSAFTLFLPRGAMLGRFQDIGFATDTRASCRNARQLPLRCCFRRDDSFEIAMPQHAHAAMSSADRKSGRQCSI